MQEITVILKNSRKAEAAFATVHIEHIRSIENRRDVSALLFLT